MDLRREKDIDESVDEVRFMMDAVFFGFGFGAPLGDTLP